MISTLVLLSSWASHNSPVSPADASRFVNALKSTDLLLMGEGLDFHFLVPTRIAIRRGETVSERYQTKRVGYADFDEGHWKLHLDKPSPTPLTAAQQAYCSEAARFVSAALRAFPNVDPQTRVFVRPTGYDDAGIARRLARGPISWSQGATVCVEFIVHSESWVLVIDREGSVAHKLRSCMGPSPA